MHRVARILFILAALILGIPPNGAGRAREVVPELRLAIVVNKSNLVDNLSLVQLRRIFLGQQSRWPSGRRIVVVMQEPGQPEREAVLRQILRMNEDEYREHFRRGLYTGQIFASPKTAADPAVVRRFVFDAKGAIGYLRASDVNESVKVVRIDGHLPSDVDYNLQLIEWPGE